MVKIWAAYPGLTQFLTFGIQLTNLQGEDAVALEHNENHW